MKKLRVLRKHTVGRPELLWNIRRGSSEEVTFEPNSEEGGRANRMGARRREVGKEDADREWINMLQGEGKEHGVTEGKGQREAVFLGRAESQTWRCRSRFHMLQLCIGDPSLACCLLLCVLTWHLKRLTLLSPPPSCPP